MTGAATPGRLIEAGSFALRPWRTDEAEWYVTARDDLVFRWTTEDPSLTAERRREAIATAGLDQSRLALAIVDAATDTPVGNLGIVFAAGNAELSYWIAARARGRNAATAALQAAAAWAETVAGVAELRLVTHPDNTASKRVAEKAGFVPAGRVPAPHDCTTDDGMVDLYIRRPPG